MNHPTRLQLPMIKKSTLQENLINPPDNPQLKFTRFEAQIDEVWLLGLVQDGDSEEEKKFGYVCLYNIEGEDSNWITPLLNRTPIDQAEKFFFSYLELLKECDDHPVMIYPKD
jgi:hypothetical protein